MFFENPHITQLISCTVTVFVWNTKLNSVQSFKSGLDLQDGLNQIRDQNAKLINKWSSIFSLNNQQFRVPRHDYQLY